MASNKEILYRAILEDGQHLVHSTDNPDLYRGISFDINNRNPHIPEFEAVEIEHRDNMSLEDAGKVAVGLWLVYLAYRGGKWAFNKFFRKNTSSEDVIEDTRPVENEPLVTEIEQIPPETIIADNLASRYQVYYDMSSKEFESCVMDIIYHMIAIANDMRYLANKRIYQEAENEEQFKQLKSEYKKNLVKGLSANLDHLLSAENLVFDEATNQKLNDLLGGGFVKDDQYCPVKFKKVNDALYMLSDKKTKERSDAKRQL